MDTSDFPTLSHLLRSISLDYRFGKPGTTDFVVAWADARNLHLADRNQDAMEAKWDLLSETPTDVLLLIEAEWHSDEAIDLAILTWMVEEMDATFLTV